jgi:hypothetical protein
MGDVLLFLVGVGLGAVIGCVVTWRSAARALVAQHTRLTGDDDGCSTCH